MSRSPWNAWLDRVLDADLTAEQHQLAVALARLIIGYRRGTSERLGDDLIRRTAQLHGRSLDRARAALVGKGLLLYEPGSPGRGHRSSYELLLDDGEKTAEARAFAAREKTAEKTAETPALERARKMEGGSERTTTPLPPPQEGERRRRSREERRGTRFTSALSPWLQAIFDGPLLDDENRERIATDWQHSTGLRWVRGAAAGTYKLDPLGEDTAPPAETPPGAGRATSEEYFRAWLKRVGIAVPAAGNQQHEQPRSNEGGDDGPKGIGDLPPFFDEP